MLIGAQGHDIIGYTPRPNQSIAWAAQSFARGATALLFFRYRAAVFGQARRESLTYCNLRLISLLRLPVP